MFPLQSRQSNAELNDEAIAHAHSLQSFHSIPHSIPLNKDAHVELGKSRFGNLMSHSCDSVVLIAAVLSVMLW